MTPSVTTVLLVSGVYPPAAGGPSLQTKQIAQTLLAQGLTVQVATYGDPAESGLRDGVPVTFLDARPQRHWLGKVQRNVRVWRSLGQLIATLRPDVIHMQTAAGNLALMTGLAARGHRIPSLLKYTADLVVQNAEMADFQPVGRWQRLRQWVKQGKNDRFQRWLFALYDSIWATTPAFATRLQAHYHLAPSKVVMLPNFIDLQAFEAIAQQRRTPAAPPHRVELLTVARLFPVKGVDVYVRSLAQLQDLPIRARIVGSGSAAYGAYLHTLVDSLGLGDRVQFTGALPPEQIAAAYGTADIFVLPSRHEPFGIVLIEAMAAGVPIVATAVDGIPQVVTAGVSAVLVPPADATQLALALRTLITQPEQRAALALAGRDRARRYALAPGVQALLAHYHTLARRPTPLLPPRPPRPAVKAS